MCVLGMWLGIAAAIGNTIAAGIVRTPGNIAAWLPDPSWFLGIWVVGGVYALCGVPSLSELAAAIPRSGGQYNFARRALGSYPGFLVGWSDWLSNCGTMAAVALVIAEYLTGFSAAILGWEKLVAASILVLFAVLQWRGVQAGSQIQLVTALLKTAAFVFLVVACFVFRFTHTESSAASSISTALPSASLQTGFSLVVSVMLALQAVIYTIDGWNGVIYFGEEVRDPGRDIPKAMVGSVISIMIIYLLLNAALLLVLPMNEIANNKFALGAASVHVFGRYGDTVVRSIMIISLLSCVNAVQLFSSRIIYAMSREGLFLKKAANVNSGGTPVFGMLLSTAVAIVFVLGSFQRVIAMLSFFFVANYTLSYISLFVLRRREPQLPRPYLAWGYPWTTGLALTGSAAFLVGSIVTDRENAPLALGLLVASYPIFRLCIRKKQGAADE